VNGFGPPAWGVGDGQDWAVVVQPGWLESHRIPGMSRLCARRRGPGMPGADQDLVRAERVAVGASRGRMRDPLPGRGLHEAADHPIKPRPRENHPRSVFSVGGGATNKAGRDHLNGRNKQTMTEQPSAGLPDQFRELATENEKRMKAIQDQIANQLEAQRKAVADLVESQQKAFADFLEQQRSVKITDHWEAQRKAISEQIEHQRKGSGLPKRRLSRTRSMQSSGYFDLSRTSLSRTSRSSSARHPWSAHGWRGEVVRVGVVPTPEPPRRLSMESALSRIELVGQCAGVRDPHRRRPFQCRAMRVQRRPVQDSITCSTMPAGAPATACPTQAT
jgi:hypothetical protein